VLRQIAAGGQAIIDCMPRSVNGHLMEPEPGGDSRERSWRTVCLTEWELRDCELGPIPAEAASGVGLCAALPERRREILGLDIGTSEDHAFWLAFLRSLLARGLSGWIW